jgi:hypothetical protein
MFCNAKHRAVSIAPCALNAVVYFGAQSLDMCSRRQSVTRPATVILVAIAVLSDWSSARNHPPASSSQAVSYAARSISAMTGSAMIGNLTLAGNSTWNAAGPTRCFPTSAKRTMIFQPTEGITRDHVKGLPGNHSEVFVRPRFEPCQSR